MSDHPPENPAPGGPVAGTQEPAPRSLSEILEQLALISHVQRGDASAMRGAVSELSRALAKLFEMIRADRAEQRGRIAELEAALTAAHARIRALEAGEELDIPAPPPNDFDQLRVAAERLRARTEQLVKAAGTPADEAARIAAAETQARADADAELAVRAAMTAEAAEVEAAETQVPEAEAAEIEAAESHAADANAPEDAPEVATTDADAVETMPAEPAVHDEPFGPPGVLRVFPGAVLRGNHAEALDVESDLGFEQDRPRAVARAVPRAVPSLPDDDAQTAEHAAVPLVAPGPAPAAAPESVDPDVQPSEAAVPKAAASEAAVPEAQPRRSPSPEPVPIAPREARRRGFPRRRRIDARKLDGVDPAAALRAMVGAIDDLWTAGHTLDLVVALTDGGALKVSGGDTAPLRVDEVEPGTAARTTVTATSEQLVPLFGRLELTGEQSAPLVHGTRRDADLLVGWIDRAQRLSAQPL